MQCGDHGREYEYVKPRTATRKIKEILYVVVRNFGSRILMRMPNAIVKDVLCLSTVNPIVTRL